MRVLDKLYLPGRSGFMSAAKVWTKEVQTRVCATPALHQSELLSSSDLR